MADDILSHINENLYFISLNSLADFYAKVLQMNTVINMLIDWITHVHSSSSDSCVDNQVITILLLLLDLVEKIRQLLPIME